MLSHSSSKKGVRVVWDEENLKHNEEIQREYSGIRIDEPKTPYRAPLPDAEVDEEMNPLELEEADDTARTAVMTAFDYVMRNGGADFTPPGPSRRVIQGCNSNASDAADAVAAAVGDAVAEGVSNKRALHVDSCPSSGSDGEGCSDPESAEKKRRFELMRKQHYNMKQALQQAKQLLASEDEDDDHQNEQENDDDLLDDDGTNTVTETAASAGWKAANGSHVVQQSSNMQSGQHQQQPQHAGVAGPVQQQQQQQRQGQQLAGSHRQVGMDGSI